MRFFTSALLLGSSLLPGALAQETDSQVTASYEVSGTCAYYFEKPGKKSGLSQTCIKYCENNGGHGYSECDRSPYANIDFENGFDKSLIEQDEEGDVWVPCKCKCENPDVEGITTAILDVVIEALEQLDNIICAVMLESFKTILDVGIMLVPGGAPANAAIRAVQGAKTFVENGLEAADYFGNWVGKACGVPDWNFDLWGALIGAPDSMGTSVGCKKKNKSECKKMDPIADPSNKPDRPSETKKDDPPATTKTDDAATTTTAPPTTTDPGTTASPTTTASSSSSTSDCGSASGTQSASSCEATTPCDIRTPDNGDPGDLIEDVIQEVTKRDHRSPRHVILEKRDKKSGKPCSSVDAYKDWVLESDNFPSNGDLSADVDAYGYKKQNDLCDHDWQSATKKIPGNKYDSEHVMEWQIVTDFFVKMQAKGGTKYTHPDPAENGKAVDFCTYWIESWSLEPGQEFSVNGSATMDAWRHIAAAYPSNNNNKAEMIALQNNINKPAKANIFTDTVPWIWNEKTMDGYVKTNRNKVLERMRQAVGTQRYLTETKIKEIFKNQKTRMGAILDELDSSFSTRPRTSTDAQGNVITWSAWVKQDLLTEWNTYMDTKWSDATAKNAKVINRWWNALDDQHCQSTAKKSQADKEFCERLRKLETEKNKVTAFTKPW